MSKLLFIDTETSGVDERVNALLEIGGVIEVDGKIMEKFSFRMRPFPDDIIDDEALDVTGFTREEIEVWDDPMKVFYEFTDLIGKYVDKYNRHDKFSLIAYNAVFDDRFLRAWFNKCGELYYGSYISWPPIDVAVLAATALAEIRPELPDFKLMTVADQLGIHIKEDNAHNAYYDIAITYKLFKKIKLEPLTIKGV